MLPTWTPRRPAAHLLPSFAPLTDAPLAFRFEVSALADGEWSAWAASATIGAAEFAPLPSATPPLTCDVDVFRAAPAVDAVRLRVRVRAAASARWIVALSTADARGVAGYLLRSPAWRAARWCHERGIPIIPSVRYAAGELRGAAVAATSGHLLVLVGLEGDTVLVNDPAAPTAASVPRRYRADELGNAWLARGGIGYILFDLAPL